MARKKDADPPELSPEWLELLENLGATSGTAKIARKEGGEEAHLETVAIGAISADPHEYLRNRWGGGTYRLRLRDEHGAYVKGSYQKLVIAGKPRYDDDEAKGPSADLEKKLAERIERAEHGSQAMMLAMIREQGENMRAQLTAQRSAPDPMALVTGVMTAMAQANAPILAALAERNQPDGGGKMLEVVETVTALVSLSQQLGPQPDGIGSLVNTLGQPISKLVDAHLSQQAQGAPAPATPNAPNAPNAPARPAWYQLLGPTLPALVSWARADRSPELRADLVVEELPDEQLELIHRTISSATFLDEFEANVPEAAAHREWFGRFFSAVLAGIVYEGADAAAAGLPAPQEPAASSADEPQKGVAPVNEPA